MVFRLAEVLRKTPATRAGERKRFDYLERVNFRYSNYFIHFKPEVKRKDHLIRGNTMGRDYIIILQMNCPRIKF